MTNGNDMIEFEENNIERLEETFIKDRYERFEEFLQHKKDTAEDDFIQQYKTEWDKFVFDDFCSGDGRR